MFEKVPQINGEQNRDIINNETTNDEGAPISAKNLEEKVTYFLGEEIKSLSQEEVNDKISTFLKELSGKKTNAFELFASALPNTATAEEIKSGNSVAAKIYYALFNFSTTDEYKNNPAVQKITRELENIIDQNPQMMGPVAMWQIAKDVMWRKDVPPHVKSSLMGSMTYALSFFDTSKYEDELLKQLDFEDANNYTEVAHMLEALKQFWSYSHESYAEDNGVPDFYLNALKKIKETPESNYLLSVRAREILSMLEKSEDSPTETIDITPFELSSGLYVSTQKSEGLTAIPRTDYNNVVKTIESFNENEHKITPPQWIIDEAVARGDTWVTWEPPQDLIDKRKKLFNEMHDFATVPIEKMINNTTILTHESKQELLFDYEYLVSKPVRELIQKEFNLELKNLTIEEQFYFLNYLKKTTVNDANSMKQFSSQYGIRGIKTFFASQYGEDYGDIILKIGEGEPEFAQEVFKWYTTLNDKALKIGELVEKSGVMKDIETSEELKEIFPKQIAEAVLRRAKDILNTAEYLTNHDFAEAPYYEGQYVKVSDEDEVIKSLKEYTAILDTIEKFMTESQDFKLLSQENGDVSTFHYEYEKDDKQSYFSIQLRENGAPIGEHDENIEYDGEARINLLFSDVPMASNLSDTARQNATSLRIDREGKIRKGDEIIGNDPTRKDGEISLEIGGVGHGDQTSPGAVIGRVVSVGNYLGLARNKKLKKERPQYYHNRESFSRGLGDADVFAGVVRKIKAMLQNK